MLGMRLYNGRQPNERSTPNAVQIPDPMRFPSILAALTLVGRVCLDGATPEGTATVAPAAAEAGKDTGHALNNAFARVFETVAPSVVIIEVAKKNDGTETSALEDLFFRGPPDE